MIRDSFTLGYSREKEHIAYEVYTNGDTAEEMMVHSRGVAICKTTDQIRSLNLSDLRTKLTASSLSAEKWYDMFTIVGIDYGPSHRGIEMLYVGDGEVLAKLSLPSSVAETQEAFILHPSILDSALQAAIDLGRGAITKPALPFSLDLLECFRVLL